MVYIYTYQVIYTMWVCYTLISLPHSSRLLYYGGGLHTSFYNSAIKRVRPIRGPIPYMAGCFDIETSQGPLITDGRNRSKWTGPYVGLSKTLK